MEINMKIEDLYDAAPVEIELTGGCFDGRRVKVPDDRDRWKFPVPVSADIGTDPFPETVLHETPVQVYAWTGSITDDGTRIFKAI